MRYLRICTRRKANTVDHLERDDDSVIHAADDQEKHSDETGVKDLTPCLPPEIVAMIIHKYYEAVSIPGELKPTSGLSIVGNSDCFFHDIYFDRNKKWITSLGPRLYEEYKERYWTDNTFVSGT